MKSSNTEKDVIIDRLKKSYPSVYLTLVSIIQATVFGYFVISFVDHLNDLTLLNILLSISTFLLIALIWNEYVIGSTSFIGIPKLQDAFLPFFVGFLQTISIPYIFSKLYVVFYMDVYYVCKLAIVYKHISKCS